MKSTWYQRNKELSKARANAYYANNKEKASAKQKERWKKNRHHMRAVKVKSVYGLSAQEYDDLIKFHHGRCAICKKERNLNIDHNHETGRVRGLLCAKCNKAIGLFEENEQSLLDAARYLKEYKDDE